MIWTRRAGFGYKQKGIDTTQILQSIGSILCSKVFDCLSIATYVAQMVKDLQTLAFNKL